MKRMLYSAEDISLDLSNVYSSNEAAGHLSEQRNRKTIIRELMDQIIQQITRGTSSKAFANMLGDTFIELASDYNIVFHHIDWDTRNNKPSNLLSMTSGAHTSFHSTSTYLMILEYLGRSGSRLSRLDKRAVKRERHLCQRFIETNFKNMLATSLQQALNTSDVSKAIKSIAIPIADYVNLSASVRNFILVDHAADWNLICNAIWEYLDNSSNIVMIRDLESVLAPYGYSKHVKRPVPVDVISAVDYLKELLLNAELDADVSSGLSKIVKKYEAQIDSKVS